MIIKINMLIRKRMIFRLGKCYLIRVFKANFVYYIMFLKIIGNSFALNKKVFLGMFHKSFAP